MAFEKSWSTVAPIPLTADGSEFGVIQVADTNGFKVKGAAQLANTNGLQMVVQVNQVLSSTIMIVGKLGSSPSATAGGLASGAVVDVSAFTVAYGSTIGFTMQPKNKIKPDDIEQATYECDPTVAVRTIPVDPYGNLYGPDYPMPVAFDGTISIGDVTVVGTAPDHYPLEPNSDGSLDTISLAQLVPYKFDEIDLTNSVVAGQTVVTVATYKQMGATVAVLNLSYDANANLTSVVRTPA